MLLILKKINEKIFKIYYSQSQVFIYLLYKNTLKKSEKNYQLFPLLPFTRNTHLFSRPNSQTKLKCRAYKELISFTHFEDNLMNNVQQYQQFETFVLGNKNSLWLIVTTWHRGCQTQVSPQLILFR